MSNQKKNIEELGFAKHGYPAGTSPKSLQEVEQMIVQVTGNLNNVKSWKQSLSELFTIPLADFIGLQYDCCLVPASVADFPADLKETDATAYVFTNRDATNGIQRLIGASSGFHFSRRMNEGQLTDWTPVQGNTIYYATFEVNPFTGKLLMYTAPGYNGPNFSLKDGKLIVTI